jgi:hypothetical protein
MPSPRAASLQDDVAALANEYNRFQAVEQAATVTNIRRPTARIQTSCGSRPSPGKKQWLFDGLASS